MNNYYVYILASNTGTLYVGVTNNLERRLFEHKNKLVPGFSAKYNITKLMCYQQFNDIIQAIEAEKRIKGWGRQKKLNLIKTANPNFSDLSENNNLQISRYARDDKKNAWNDRYTACNDKESVQESRSCALDGRLGVQGDKVKDENYPS